MYVEPNLIERLVPCRMSGKPRSLHSCVASLDMSLLRAETPVPVTGPAALFPQAPRAAPVRYLRPLRVEVTIYTEDASPLCCSFMPVVPDEGRHAYQMVTAESAGDGNCLPARHESGYGRFNCSRFVLFNGLSESERLVPEGLQPDLPPRLRHLIRQGPGFAFRSIPD